jgi:hypothetical protein
VLLRSGLGQSENPWRQIGRGQVRISKPQFEKVEGEHTYYWLSKVTYVRLYEGQHGRLGVLPPVSERRLMVLIIDVQWKANIRADGRFFDCEIVNHKENDYSFKVPTSEELKRYGIQESIEQASADDTQTPG